MSPPPPASREDLMARFAELGITTTTVEHAPAFTVDEAKDLRGDLPGGHCKTLFLKSKKGPLYLVVALEDRKVPLTPLAKHLGVGRFSFGTAERMQDILGVTPGSVTPFGLINDHRNELTVVLDADMMDYDRVHYHPLKNDATTAIAPADLLRFIESCGHTPLTLSFDHLNAAR